MINNDDPRATRSRVALSKALLSLVEEKALDQITVREIASRAKVGYATFFRHFPTKEALLEAVAADQIRCLINLSLPIMAAQDMRAAEEALFTYVYAHRSLWSALLTGGAASFVREEFIRRAKEAAIPLTPAGGKIPAEMGVMLIVSGTLEMLAYWLRQPKPMPIKQISELYDLVVISPILQANTQL